MNRLARCRWTPFLAALLWAPACSYVFVTPPREASDGRLLGECTTDRAAPVLDTLLMTTNALSAIYAARADDVKNRGTAVGLGVGAAALWLSSAIYGYYNTARCSEMLEDGAPHARPVPQTGYIPPRPPWQPMPPPTPPPVAPPPAPPGPAAVSGRP